MPIASFSPSFPIASARHWVMCRAVLLGAIAGLAASLSNTNAAEKDGQAAREYRDKIAPLLTDFCFDCHGDGSAKGEVALDDYENLSAHLGDQKMWLRVWQNLRTQLMPPADEDLQPSEAERRQLTEWIERRIFKLDPDNPDPGRVTVRRMNREEYRNTIHDLLGVDYNVEDNFPPDDTGFGFDTIGDVLSLSPLLLEKYLAAAEEIAELAMPANAGKPEPLRIDPGSMREPGNGRQTARFMEAEIGHTVRAEREFDAGGEYAVQITYSVEGMGGNATGQTANWRFLLDGKPLDEREIRWDKRGNFDIERVVSLAEGQRRFEFDITPGDGAENPDEKLGVRLVKFELQRIGVSAWDLYPNSYKNILFKGLPPQGSKAQEEYMREIVERFAARAFRRPVEASLLDKLTDLGLGKAAGEGMAFVDGVKFAVTAILTSPRFLFRREEQPEPDNPGKIVPVDQYALASRLSYFLWSSAPDEQLLKLAAEGKLRANLRSEVDRMIDDPKSARMVANFVGQWLQARDIETLNIDVRRILRERSRRTANRVFNGNTRRDMRLETEMFFSHVLEENRPILELLTADYSFLNENLADFYDIPGVDGQDFRKVDFDDRAQGRGGILGQGTFLIVSSNPTRTSPVKRGLFVLDNILGTPAPPAPPDVPELEEVQEAVEENATMRELMKAHREKPLCHSCHARMDPIGLALENFDALGRWRDEENGQRIDSAGQLITGEKFANVIELKRILSTSRQQDFYRCLTEKMLTYAIGRGVEYFDAPSVNKIVTSLGEDGGMRQLIYGIVESAPFQMRRGDGDPLE